MDWASGATGRCSSGKQTTRMKSSNGSNDAKACNTGEGEVGDVGTAFSQALERGAKIFPNRDGGVVSVDEAAETMAACVSNTSPAGCQM